MGFRPTDWERTEELFHQALPLDPRARATLLLEISTEDPVLGEEVESLLAAHDSEGVLDRLQARIAPEPIGTDGPNNRSTDGLTGTLIGHYEVAELIGRGGMGDVYRARDTRLSRDVALKFLPHWLGRDRSARDRFLVEARVVSSIDHPNVCTLHEMGDTEDGRLFLVMPYYEGETLKRRLACGPLPAPEAVEIALQAACGLAAAHERGVVHRDIKPANLLLTESGTVKILDFGIAKLVDVSLTRPDQQPGTALYMSPEQAAGSSVDARSDLWSLGLVLFEMLTGERPAAGTDKSGLSGALSDMPRGLADVVRQLLAQSPEDRYPDAHSLAQDLTVLASGSGTLAARPAPVAQRLLAELKRRRVFRAAAVYGVAGFAVLAAVDVIFPRIPLPDWTVGLVVWLVLLGFPLVLVLAWAFETSPSGVRRTRSMRPAILDAIVAQPASRRWPIGLAGLVGGALIMTGAWFALGGRAVEREDVSLTPGVALVSVTEAGLPVAVLPFRVVGQGEPLESLHEGIVHLLAYNVEAVDGLRTIDPSAVMWTWRERFGEAGDASSQESAIAVARQLGARYAVLGSAVGIGSAIRLTVDVHDLEREEHLGSTHVQGQADPDSVFSLIEQLAVAILRDGLLPSDDVQPLNLSRVTTRSFPAFNAYLEGEREFRLGQYSDAAPHFVRAAELDTTFARAMYRAAGSYEWMNESDLAEKYAGRAASFADRLPVRDSLLFVAVNSGSSKRIPLLERLTSLYPDDVDAWAQLGDAYWHAGSRRLLPLDASRNAWTQALEFNAVNDEHYFHLLEDAFARRDSKRARELLDRFATLHPDGNSYLGMELAYASAWGDELDRARAEDLLKTIGTEELVDGWTTLAVGSATTDEMERRDRVRLRLLEPQSFKAEIFWRMLQARMMRGELSAARDILSLVDGVPAMEEWAARYVVQWYLTDFPDSAAADRAAQILARQPLESSLVRGSHNSPFWLGVFAVSEGRWEDAETEAARLEAAVDTVGVLEPRYREETAAMAEAVRHYARLARSWDPDLSGFEDSLGRLRSVGFAKDEPEQFLRYRIGQELFARGDMRGAERYFRSFTPYQWSHFVPAQYHLGRIYEQLGEHDKASEHYRIFVGWWETADPELQPWVEDGIEALRRLAPDS